MIHELGVIGVVLPGRDLNSIAGLPAEVYLDVINNYYFVEVAA